MAPGDAIEPQFICFEDEYGNVWRWIDGRAVFVRTCTRGKPDAR